MSPSRLAYRINAIICVLIQDPRANSERNRKRFEKVNRDYRGIRHSLVITLTMYIYPSLCMARWAHGILDPRSVLAEEPVAD